MNRNAAFYRNHASHLQSCNNASESCLIRLRLLIERFVEVTTDEGSLYLSSTTYRRRQELSLKLAIGQPLVWTVKCQRLHFLSLGTWGQVASSLPLAFDTWEWDEQVGFPFPSSQTIMGEHNFTYVAIHYAVTCCTRDPRITRHKT